MSRRKIIFWQKTPSPHQSAYIRALAQIANVKLVVTGELEPERHALGWRQPDFGNAETLIKPDKKTIVELQKSVDADTVQIFSEFISDPGIRDILSHSLAAPGLLGILSEGRDWRGAKGLLRQAHGWVCERRFARRVDFVLGIGHLANQWYRRCGYQPQKIFDFAYVVEPPTDREPVEYHGPLRILYVGQLIPRKRVDLLLQALSQLGGLAWHLRIIGDGPQTQALAGWADTKGLSRRVCFLGVKDNAEVRRELANADVLVLPSHWDGWGAVVNEALMAGTRALCSEFCGAAELLRDTPFGGVFACDSAAALAEALKQQIAAGPVNAGQRQTIKQYAQTFAGPAIADYLGAIIDFVGGEGQQRPIAPWQQRAFDAG